MSRNLTDEDIDALAKKMLANEHLVKKVVSSCSGRFVQEKVKTNSALEKTKKELLAQARQSLEETLSMTLESHKYDVRSKITNWFHEHYQLIVDKTMKEFQHSITEAEMKKWLLSEVQEEIKNAVRSRVSTATVSVSLDDVLDF